MRQVWGYADHCGLEHREGKWAWGREGLTSWAAAVTTIAVVSSGTPLTGVPWLGSLGVDSGALFTPLLYIHIGHRATSALAKVPWGKEVLVQPFHLPLTPIPHKCTVWCATALPGSCSCQTPRGRGG